MDTFYEDFTNALRSCVSSRFYASPLDKWSPHETAAPERHKMLSEAMSDESWEDDASALDHQNAAFGLLESMLHVFFAPFDVADEVDDEKEQVWLFAHHWLSVYYEFLMDTRAVSTNFYKQHHARFLEILRHSLCVSAARRYTFRELALDWNPSLVPAAPMAKAVVESAASVSVPVSVFPATVVPAVPAVPASVVPAPPKRLVLQGPRGHNRTRRNLRN